MKAFATVYESVLQHGHLMFGAVPFPNQNGASCRSRIPRCYKDRLAVALRLSEPDAAPIGQGARCTSKGASWEPSDGGSKQYRTEIVAFSVQFSAHVPPTFRRATSNRLAVRWTKTFRSEWFERNQKAGPSGSALSVSGEINLPALLPPPMTHGNPHPLLEIAELETTDSRDFVTQN